MVDPAAPVGGVGVARRVGIFFGSAPRIGEVRCPAFRTHGPIPRMTLPASSGPTRIHRRRDAAILLIVCAALIGIGLAGGALLLEQLRTQLHLQQAEAARRNAEAMARILARDLRNGGSASEVIDRLRTATRGMGDESEFLCLLDERGVLLSHPNPQMIGLSKAAFQVSRIDAPDAPPETVAALTGRARPGAGLLREKPGATTQVVYYQPVEGTSWLLAAHENAAAVAAQVERLGQRLAAIALPTVALMALTGTLLARGLGRRYERRIEAANAELEQRVAERTKQLSDALAELRAAHERLVQSDKLHLLGELMSGIAHEINNPMTVLNGYAAVLADDRFGPEVKRHAERLATSAQRVSAIVENLLSFARNRPPARRPVASDRLVARAIDLIGAELRREHIALAVDVPERPPLLLGDEQQLEQVILNLLNNARHALVESEGERRIRLSVTSEDGMAALEVSDSGPGIAPEVRARLFQPFFTTKPGGNGIGLSLCRRFVEAHGGAIEVPERTTGTTFVVRLPMAASPQAVAA